MNDGDRLERAMKSIAGGRSVPIRVELDPDYRYPQHRWPDPRRLTMQANDGRPTDPAVLAEIERLVAAFAARYQAEHGEALRWEAGYREDEIATAEAQLGLRLPEDLRALYRLVHDDVYESGVAGLLSPMPLEQVVEWYGQVDETTFNDETGVFARQPVVVEVQPYGHIRRMSGNDRWVPFASDFAMNFGVVDLDPAPGGQYGQIFTYGRDGMTYVAPSIGHLMRAVLAEDEPLDRFRNSGAWDPPAHDWNVALGDRSLTDLVAAEDDPARVQSVLIRVVTELRLGDLAGLCSLRSIRVGDRPEKAAHVDLTLPTGAPVELVDVIAATFEPERLADAPHLAYLTLSGNDEPVRIAELATAPNMVRLDLSGAILADVTAVAMFPALRVLTLNGAQWQALLESGWNPRGLAAAQLTGPRTEAQEVTFRQAMSRDT